MKYWIKVFFIIVLCQCSFAIATVENAKRGVITGEVDVKIPDWFKLSFLDFREETKEAGENNKHVLLFFHIEGCPYCHKMLQDNFFKSTNKAFIKENFASIDINVQGAREVVFNDKLTVTEKQLAEVQGVKLTPAILFMNADNQMVMRIDGYRSPAEFREVLNYVHQKVYYKMDFATYHARNNLKAVYKLAKMPTVIITDNVQKLTKNGKTIAVLFEDKTCSDCSRFHHKILNIPKTQQMLQKINLVRFDALSEQKITDINGKETTPKQWVKRLGITYRPAIVFYSPEAKEIERLTGFIKTFHFQSLLGYATGNCYKKYNKWTDYMAKRRDKILKAGRDIDIWE